MNKFILISIFFFLASLLPLNANSTFKGQKVYLKECRTCHLGSNIFIKTHTNNQWRELLDSEGIKLSNIHLNKSIKNIKSKDGIIKNSHSFFKRPSYKKEYKILREYIVNK